MGHSLSVITRNTFHEFGIFHAACSDDAVKKLYDASISASRRYLQEMDIVEIYLAQNGFPGTVDVLQDERDMIAYIVKPALNGDEVQQKAAYILDVFVPSFVQQRLHRLYSLVDALHVIAVPEILQRTDKAILRAYEALRADKNRTDAVQDALVILATMNWKPKQVPECLPLLHYQTVARLRNKVLKRLSDTELFMFKHQQTHLDLEAFLIITALLSEI
jgi:MoxR-like ATPase